MKEFTWNFVVFCNICVCFVEKIPNKTNKFGYTHLRFVWKGWYFVSKNIPSFHITNLYVVVVVVGGSMRSGGVCGVRENMFCGCKNYKYSPSEMTVTVLWV